MIGFRKDVKDKAFVILNSFIMSGAYNPADTKQIVKKSLVLASDFCQLSLENDGSCEFAWCIKNPEGKLLNLSIGYSFDTAVGNFWENYHHNPKDWENDKLLGYEPVKIELKEVAR